ncbi:MAG: nitrilase-related carbon-nitrogen hydrolase [Candidatus Thorarchaeota archaeon]
MRIGVAQMEPHVCESEYNLKHLSEILKKADSEDVDVLVIPELANSGYAFNSLKEVEKSAEEIPSGIFSNQLLEWSGNERLVVAGICEKKNGRLYNSAGIFSNGKLMEVYRKIHLFSEEKRWFTPGSVEPPVVRHGEYNFGIMICWDWIFPEVSRILTLKGAQVVLHPANLVLAYCQAAMVTRSIENGIFTATANRIGTERELMFSGKSQITDTRGKVLISMPDGITGVYSADISPSEADNKHMTKKNHLLNDRRPDLYSRIAT